MKVAKKARKRVGFLTDGRDFNYFCYHRPYSFYGSSEAFLEILNSEPVVRFKLTNEKDNIFTNVIFPRSQVSAKDECANNQK